MRLRCVLAMSLVVCLWSLLVACDRGKEMLWSETKDGFEESYFREPNGPVYVRRKLSTTGCVFGDFPDERPPAETKVACGATWIGSSGHKLVCTCVDGGS